MKFIILNSNGDYYFDNYGWNSDTASIYSEDEKATLDLPKGGVWKEIKILA